MRNYYPTFFLILALCTYSCANSQDKSKSATALPKHSATKEDSNKLPAPVNFINDFAKVFTKEQIQLLDSIVKAYEKRTTIEIAVVTIDSAGLKGHDFEIFTLELANYWGIGKKDKNNGLLIGISPDLKMIRIQNGFGIEKIFSNSETKKIVDSISIPYFKKGALYEGTKQTILAIIKKLDEK